MTYDEECFPEFLTALLADRGISVSGLARILDYKSKTTLVRALGDTAGTRSIERISDDLVKSPKLALSDSEKERCESAACRTIKGCDKYLAEQKMLDLLKPDAAVNFSFRLLDATGDFISESDALEFIDDPNKIVKRILIVGCCFDPVIRLAEKALRQNHGLSIRHYIPSPDGESELAARIRTVFPVIYNNNYHACFYDRSTGAAENDLIFIETSDTRNSVREYQLTFDSTDSGILTHTAKGTFDHMAKRFENAANLCHPLKSEFPVIATAADYLGYTESAYKLEQGSDIYAFLPDICVSLVERDIVYAAFVDGLREKKILLPSIKEFILDLSAIHEKRFRNIFSKKRVTHMIFSEKDMRAFTMTGRQKNHIFAMRPFTVSERISIFKNFIDQCVNNPFVNFYILKDDSEYLSTEVICYGDRGVYFVKTASDYDLSGGHSEFLITDQGFSRLYKLFYLNELLKKHTRPIEDSIKLFKELIMILEDMK